MRFGNSTVEIDLSREKGIDSGVEIQLIFDEPSSTQKSIEKCLRTSTHLFFSFLRCLQLPDDFALNLDLLL
jgi:hypothetical protein